ncbi:MAG: CpsB/CapC family capsule biosynthesis tyrosine phosphatase, partial [Acidobacteriota bacterium]
MIDLHTHILFGVDDGAADLDESVAMVRRSVDDGITALVATPHVRHPSFWNGDTDRLRARFDAVVEAVADAELTVDLHFGGEIAVSSTSLDEIQQLPAGTLPRLGASRWLLLELDWHGIGPDPEELVHEVQVVDHRPLIAHPERVRWLIAEPRRLAALVTAGARLQLTAQSVVGALGPEAESAALDLIDRGLVHCVASD